MSKKATELEEQSIDSIDGIDGIDGIDSTESIESFVGRFIQKKISKEESLAFFRNLTEAEKKLVLVRIENHEAYASTSHKDKEKVETSTVNIASAEASNKKPSAAVLDITSNFTCTDSQKAFLKRFSEQYISKTRGSKQYAEKYRSTFADQRTPVKFNPMLKEVHYPITYQDASGAYVTDIDNNRYIDIACDYGVNLFGHKPPFVAAALQRQIDKGWALSGRYEEIGEAADLFCKITGKQRIAFCQSGSEALMSALRIARAYSQKNKVVVFDYSYHGHADTFLDTNYAGVPGSSEIDRITLQYDDPRALDAIREHADEIAAVIVEPVQSEQLSLQPVAFLRALRQITEEKNIVFIFDEMITSFRVHPKGCQGVFGIDADLTTYGKILGGGITAGAVAGKREILDWVDGGNWKYGDKSKPQTTSYIAGTHTQNPLKMAATLAILKEVEKQSPRLQESLTEKTTWLVNKVNDFTSENRLPLKIVQFGSQFKFYFSSGRFTLTQALFLFLLNDKGVRYNLHGNCFLNACHTQQDLSFIVDAIQQALKILMHEGFFSEKGAKKNPALNKTVPLGKYENKARTVESKPAVSKEKILALVERDLEGALQDIQHSEINPGCEKCNTDSVDKGNISVAIKALIGDTLEISPDQLEEDEELDMLGVDSIIFMGIVRSIALALDIELTASNMKGINTINSICQFISENYPDKIQALFPSDPGVSQQATKAESKCAECSEFESTQFLQKLCDAVKKQYGILLVLDAHVVKSVRDCAEYLLQTHSNALLSYYGFDKPGLEDVPSASKSESLSHIHSETSFADKSLKETEIVIVGMSARFPEAKDVNQYWQNMLDEKCSTYEIPRDRWSWEDHYSSTKAVNKTQSKWGAFLDGVKEFDPLFFNIAPREARWLDPQGRLLLQESYKALEDSGIPAGTLSGSNTGVFIGYEFMDYDHYLKTSALNEKDAKNPLSNITNEPYFLANRISFTFDLAGPSESVNVNCASSAVAINRAYHALLQGECDLAIVGGVGLNLLPDRYILTSDLLSTDGSCRVFDDTANGFTKGEGCGVIVLKRKEDAIQDKNPIYSIVKSCHQNNRGRASSLSEIKPASITDVLHRCYHKKDIAAESIKYIEVDGYSTQEGDVTEFEAIKRVFSPTEESRVPNKTCALGSLKGNIGNLEPASAIASVIKLAMSMKHGMIPATISCTQVNKSLNIDDSSHPFYIADRVLKLNELKDSSSEAIRVGINSFADSGVNVHIVLEENKPGDELVETSVSAKSEPQLFVLSARTKNNLNQYLQDWKSYLLNQKDINLADLSYSLQHGREEMKYRFACVVDNVEMLIKRIDSQQRGEENPRYYYSKIDASFSEQHSNTRAEVERLAINKNLEGLAEKWVKGVVIPWAHLHEGSAARHLPLLPTYPFSTKSYWVDAAEKSLPKLASEKIAEMAEPC